jgi:hypothetical protein
MTTTIPTNVGIVAPPKKLLVTLVVLIITPVNHKLIEIADIENEIEPTVSTHLQTMEIENVIVIVIAVIAEIAVAAIEIIMRNAAAAAGKEAPRIEEIEIEMEVEREVEISLEEKVEITGNGHLLMEVEKNVANGKAPLLAAAVVVVAVAVGRAAGVDVAPPECNNLQSMLPLQ